MDLIWINLSDKLLEGVQHANKLNDESFNFVLDYIIQKHFTKSSDDIQINLEKIDRSNFSPQEFSLLVKTLTFVFKRAANFIMKPTKLQQDLKDKLRLELSKSEIFLKFWITQTKPILDNLGDIPLQLEDVSWNLKVQLSSSAQIKEKVAIGCLKLQTNGNGMEDNIMLEMTKGELLDFYDQLESIQTELDSLKK